MFMAWKAIIRDVFIVYVMTFIAGFVLGFMGVASPATLSLATLIFGTIGFAISGCLAKVNRFSHLIKVAFGLWLVSLSNIFILGTTVSQWLLSAIIILIMMGAGGGISFLFVRNTSSTTTA